MLLHKLIGNVMTVMKWLCRLAIQRMVREGVRQILPLGTKVLPAVWAMRRKRRIAAGEPYKWKARVNLHHRGKQQEHGINYWERYAPVIGWTTIRLFLILTLLNGWASWQVDFVLAYPQADIECTMYMGIPRGYTFKGSGARTVSN
jgi:hypothetical protein